MNTETTIAFLRRCQPAFALQATYTQRMSFSTDSYFMIDCLNGRGIVPSPGRWPPPPAKHRFLDAPAPPPVPLVSLETEAAGMQQGSHSHMDSG